MEYLTYPFHNPPPASAHRPPSPLASTGFVAEPEEELDLSNIAGTSASSFASSASGWTVTPSIHSRTDSELSRTSSQLISENNAAFSKLRNLGPSSIPDVPEQWRDYAPPSVNKGHWRTFGPVDVKVYCLAIAEGTKSKEVKSLLKTSRSSTCTGTVWVTDEKLLFVLAEGSTAVHNDAEEEKKHGIVSSWLGKRKSESRTGTADEEVPIMDFETGYLVTGFQIPVSTLSKVDSKRKSSSHRRSESSSLSRSLSRTSTRSTSATPTLSRSQSRASNGVQAAEAPSLLSFDDKEARPTVVVVEAKPENRFVRLEFSFTSTLYKEEAKDFVARLETGLR